MLVDEGVRLYIRFGSFFSHQSITHYPSERLFVGHPPRYLLADLFKAENNISFLTRSMPMNHGKYGNLIKSRLWLLLLSSIYITHYPSERLFVGHPPRYLLADLFKAENNISFLARSMPMNHGKYGNLIKSRRAHSTACQRKQNNSRL